MYKISIHIRQIVQSNSPRNNKIRKNEPKIKGSQNLFEGKVKKKLITGETKN